MKRAKASASPQRAKTGRLWWAAAALVLAGVLAYANGLSNPFVFDDFGSIVLNTTIRDVWNWRAVFSPPDASAVAGRPLANLSLAINYAISGSSVVGFRAVNLLLHVTCALLLFALVRRTLEYVGRTELQSAKPGGPQFGPPYVLIAGAIALLWVVHPINSEVVDYLSQRTESMMAACYLFTLYAGLRAIESDARRPARWLAAGVLSCAAGMACKESMVTAPVMVVIFDAVFLFDGLKAAMRARWRYYVGLASTWLLLVALIASHGSVSSGGFASAQTTAWTYLMNQAVIVTRYFRLVLWPTGLVNYYGWTQPLTLADVWPCALFLVALLVGVLVVFMRRPRLGFLGVWVFITLSPASSIAPIAAEVGAERRMYLPLMGVMGILVLGVFSFLVPRSAFRVPFSFSFGRRNNERNGERNEERGTRNVERSVASLVLACTLALAATTFVRNRDYASALTLARTTLAAWPTANAHQLVGQELGNLGQHDEAIQHLREAVPGYPPARYSLGAELFATGRLNEAIDELQQFVRDEPDLPPVPRAHILMARAFAMTGRVPQAIEQLQLVLQKNPDDAATHGLLADTLAAEQAFADAIPHYRAFLAANPDNATAWTGLGLALVATGDARGSADAFRHAVAAAPGDTHMRQNLARALLDQGDAAGALREAQQAVTLGTSDPAAHEILGRVLAAQGRIDDAIRELQRALQIDPSYTPAIDALRSIKR